MRIYSARIIKPFSTMQNLNKVKYNPILQQIGDKLNDEAKLYNTKEIWQKSIGALQLNEALSQKWG